jgi:hypothetical protein
MEGVPVVRVVSLMCLLAAFACSACAQIDSQSALTIGCRPGGVNSQANPCNGPNAAVGAASTVPYDGWR